MWIYNIHHSSYFNTMDRLRPTKHSYEVTPSNEIYPIKERLQESAKFFSKKEFSPQKCKDSNMHEFKDEYKEEIKYERKGHFNSKLNLNNYPKGYIKENITKPKDYDGDNQRGQADNRYFANDQRKLENKAIFARQLQSIQKTITSHFTKDVPIGRPQIGGDSKYPLAKGDRYDTKITAFAGSGIIGDYSKKNDDYIIITSFEKEEPKHSHLLEISKNNNSFTSRDEIMLNHGKSKRTNAGFRASAAAMFTNQTGEKCIFTDYD